METILSTTAAAMGFVGAVTGCIALYFTWRDRRKSYLHIHLKVEVMRENYVTALVTVENRTVKRNDLCNASLLIGPENEDPGETVRLLGFGVSSTNELAEIQTGQKIEGKDGRSIIPLPFFFDENLAIADETITYRCPINSENIQPGITYSVRLFVKPKTGYHRTTQDCFMLPQ